MKSTDLQQHLLGLRSTKAPDVLRARISTWTNELENNSRFNPLFYMLRPTALALIILLVIGTGTTWAAYSSQPGDLLYPVKIMVENTLEHIFKPKVQDIPDTKNKQIPNNPDDSTTNTPPVLPQIKNQVETDISQTPLPEIKIDPPNIPPPNVINEVTDPLKKSLETCLDCLVPKF